MHNWVVEGVSLPQMVQVHALHCLTLSPHCLIHDLDRKNFRCHYHTNYQSQTSVDKGFSPAHFTVCGSKNSSHMITFCGSAVCKKVAFNERKLKVSRQSCIMWLVLWKPQSSKKNCYHMTRFVELQTETNGPGSVLRKALVNRHLRWIVFHVRGVIFSQIQGPLSRKATQMFSLS